MRIKDDSVSLQGLSPSLIIGILICERVLEDHGYEFVFTSGGEQETKHGHSSLHYDGKAVDFRSNHIEYEAEKTLIFAEMKERLNMDFDLLLEGQGQSWEHFHIEFQPKRRDHLFQ